MRPWQWIKNGLVLVPLVFGLRLGYMSDVYLALGAFLVFCLVSSAVYCLNDVLDLRTDLLDEENKKRPLAAGMIGVTPTILVSIVLLIGGLAISLSLVSPMLAGIISVYYVLNLVYAIYLKQIIPWGAIVIALGFVLRVYAGASVIAIELSSWLILVTFFTALFVSLIKLKHKFANSSNINDQSYTIYLDASVNITAGLVIVIYCLWVILGQEMLIDQRMLVSIPFVIGGILRFIFLNREANINRDPTILIFKDKQLLVTFACWMISCILCLYVQW